MSLDLEAILQQTVAEAETRDSYSSTYYQFERCFRVAGYDGLVQFT